MTDFLISLKDAPLPSLLLILGVFCILLGILGKMEKLSIPVLSHSQRSISGIFGLFLLVIALVLYIQPSTDLFPFIKTSTPTNLATNMTPIPTSTPFATSTSTLSGIPTQVDISGTW